jgi:uncharacterized protein YeeX (DUF496 family)
MEGGQPRGRKQRYMPELLSLVQKFHNDNKLIIIMQQIGNKKVIHGQTREIICNMFDYMRITFHFELLTKIKERVFIFSIY